MAAQASLCARLFQRQCRVGQYTRPSHKCFATLTRQAYENMHRSSLTDRDKFWGEAAKGIDWVRPPSVVLDAAKKPFYNWYPDGQLNVCYNAVDRHLPTRGEQNAIIYDSPVTGTIRTLTYRELHGEVSRAAGMLRDLGVQMGDRVVIYMPMIPEALIAMLACARLGAVHSVVFGGFGANELSARIDDCEPVVVLAASCGVEPTRVVEYMPLLNRAIDLAKSKPRSVIVKQREQCTAPLLAGRDFDWDKEVSKAKPAECTTVDANHPLYILYTSGTTGAPKGILHDGAPHAVALKWSMSNFMRTEPGEVYWAASDVGWVVGHSYIVYGPLLQGCTTVLFEGKPVGTPDAGAYWRVIEQHKVRGLFTAPTALRAIRKEDPQLELLNKYDISSLRTLYVAGERCDPTTAEVYAEAMGIPVVDHWWQTETAWPICGFRDEAVGTRPGSAGLPFPGYDIKVLDNDGEPVSPGGMGNLAVKLPLPPSCFPTLWGRPDDYVKLYMSEFPGYYNTGDAGTIDADGYVTVLERTDDVINVAAHRLSTGHIEAVVKAQKGVSDAAVFGADDATKGQVPVACVVLNSDAEGREHEIIDSIRREVREQVGPIASLAGVVPVAQLPKTRSGKVLRKNIRGLANSKPYPVPGTIDNPEAIDIVTKGLQSIGFAKGL